VSNEFFFAAAVIHGNGAMTNLAASHFARMDFLSVALQANVNTSRPFPA